MNYNNPQLGKDLIRVLNAIGIGVQLLHKEKCCGVPLIANGFFAKARKQAQSNVTAMRENNLPVVATSSTCTFTLRDEYPHVLDIDNHDVRDRVELATRWIWRQLDAGRKLALKSLPLKVIYHTPCHMEKMGWSLYTLELLRLIPACSWRCSTRNAAVLPAPSASSRRITTHRRRLARRCSDKLRRAARTW